MSIREKIKQLEMEREELKADLFDALAEQAEQIRLWTVEGISTPLEQRLELQAEIKDLEAQRQVTKVALMKLKQRLREVNELTYRQVVEEVLQDRDHYGIASCTLLEIINSRYEKGCA